MITEQDLNEAIAECQGVRHPDARTCMMLASFYALKDKLFPELPKVDKSSGYSYDAPKTIEETINYSSDTDFGNAVYGKKSDYVLSVIDEAMEAIQVFQPTLYKSIMRKIEY